MLYICFFGRSSRKGLQLRPCLVIVVTTFSRILLFVGVAYLLIENQLFQITISKIRRKKYLCKNCFLFFEIQGVTLTREKTLLCHKKR